MLLFLQTQRTIVLAHSTRGTRAGVVVPVLGRVRGEGDAVGAHSSVGLATRRRPAQVGELSVVAEPPDPLLRLVATLNVQQRALRKV